MISRHDPEWLKAMFLAGAAGVRLEECVEESLRGYHLTHWRAYLPDGHVIKRSSKYLAACAALFYLEHGTGISSPAPGGDAPLPDAARAPRSAAYTREDAGTGREYPLSDGDWPQN